MAVDISNLVGKSVAVVGGANLDIKGRSYHELRWGTSNPGETLTCPGGVGRNIAEALARLGVPVSLITALGEDLAGQEILNLCQGAGVDMSRVRICPGHRTGTYLAITSPQGELEAALADMAILEEVNPQLVAEHQAFLRGTGIIAADANLPGETLAALAELAGYGPVLALEAVSVEKVEKLLPFLGRAAILAANRREMAHLSGLDLTGLEGWRQASQWHQQRGGQLLLLKLGSQGLFIGSKELSCHLPVQAAQVKDSTGAGDSLLAGFLAAIWGGANLKQAGYVALAAAQGTLASPYSVARELTPGLIGEILCTFR